MRVVIAGGGIGGATAAIALRRRGIEAAVLEAAPEPSHIGGGMFVWSNATRALEPLGLSERVQSLGERIERFQFVSYHGRRLMDWPLGELGDELGAATVCAARGDLLDTLLGELEPGVVQYGEKCVGFDQDGSGVTVRLASGREERGDALIGADGRDSAVRAGLGLPMQLRPFGLTTWRATIPFERDRSNPEGVVRSHFGNGCHFIFQPVAGARQFWSAAKPIAAGDDREDGLKQALLERYRDFPAPVTQMIAATGEAQIVRTDFADREPGERWGGGRVTLLGDSAHAMAPNAGQGACQAIEDAVVLAECLAEGGGVGDGLRAYEARRVPRTKRMTEYARRNANSLRLTNPVACTIRAMVMRVVGRTGAGYRQYARLVAQEL